MHLLRKITGSLGKFEKKRLWKQGYFQSLATDSWTRDEINDYHNQRLVQLVRRAYENIPFYHHLYDQANIDVLRFAGIKDMHLLPTIDKSILLKYGDEMVQPKVGRFLLCEHTTGGSTGTVANIVSRRGFASYESGCIYALWKRIGVKPKDSMLVLRGALIDNGERLYKHEKSSKRLTISTYHLTEQNTPTILKLIEEFKPCWWHVYPSAVSLFLNMLDKLSYSLPVKPKGVLCGSEKLYPWQFGVLKDAVSANVYSHYGHGEYALLGGWCESNQTLHFLPNHGYVELVGDNGKVIKEPGEMGEIVGTGFVNDAMPLIRYKTADYGQWDSFEACPGCDRYHQRLKSIEGRIQEFLILENNAKFSATNINALHGKFFSYIYRFQFHQNIPGHAILKFVPAVEFTHDTKKEILKGFEGLKTLGLTIELQPVDNIPLTQSGKERIVIKTGKAAQIS